MVGGVKLDAAESWERLAGQDHGLLATRHEVRGVDAVPVVFAVAAGRIVVPTDLVKPKRSTRLQREANLAADPRCVLLVEHYEEDWSALWWVRVHADGHVEAPTPAWLDALAARYPAYRAEQSVAKLLVLEPTAVAGWAAS